MKHPGRAYPMQDKEIVVLPEPDSPIKAMTCPGLISNVMLSTIL